MKKRSSGGFTLIELLVVVAIVGVLAGMAIFNYLRGLERAKQRRTMSDMRAIAVAWEARATDVRGYNAAGAAWNVPASPLTVAEAGTLLTPTYLKNLPSTDGWNRPFEFRMDNPVGGAAALEYSIRSAGRDGAFEGTTYTQGTTDEFDCDIVYSNGSFISYPAPQ